MKVKLLFASAVSACFELENETIYYAEKEFDVYLDGKLAIKGEKRNVFSIFNLEPGRSYVLKVGDFELPFKTEDVSLTLHMKDFKRGSYPNDDNRIAAAIATLPPKGLLVFDEGEYHATNIFLKSEITIELKKGATIYGNPNVEDYTVYPGEVDDGKGGKKQLLTWEGGPLQGKPSLIHGCYAHHVRLVGEGKIDAMADKSVFWINVKKLGYARPRTVYLLECEDVRLHGVDVGNSPSWTIHPYFSKHLGFYDLKIHNPKDAPNTDGLDPECCEDVEIIGTYFSVGDDCIAIKSGKIYIGKTYKTPSRHITIRNCYMHEGHGAVVLGSEIGAGLVDLKVERCFFEHTDRGLRIKSRRGRGKDSVLDGIVFKNIKMQNVLSPLTMTMFYFCDPDGKDEWVQKKTPSPIDDGTPYLGSFLFENLECRDCEYALGVFYGLPERPIGKIVIKDSTFTVKENAGSGHPVMMCDFPECGQRGFIFVNVGEVELENVEASGFKGEEFDLTNVGSLKRK